MGRLEQEKTMDSRETLAALSEGMADAVARAGRSIVRVHGRRRRPGSGVVFAEDLVLTAGQVVARGDELSGGAGGSRARVRGRRRRPGSGVVFAEDLLLTAGHVLEREEDLSVETAEGRTLAARFVGRDHSSDLAGPRGRAG